ncbi:PTS lactose/cellobiose transporter subunit IIA [Anaerosinus massiliensis]|uniref:PTS lactose/cellobiose transporter subunit IIA n=1 Tax=Massilibacillus massiliensis TaxID=1806837 RepID=UPI000AB639B7|nr:PTS lactose/cellobiose transporter subunit IIA [Massilibacillus massiliensis]
MNSEQIVFTMILHAGDARSHALEALRCARKGEFSKAEDLMGKAKAELIEAHHIQTELLQAESRGEKQEVNLLLIHAQDHLMTAILAKDLIEEMILLYKK